MSVRPDESAEFEFGVRQGSDPQPAFRATSSGVALTRPGSWWSYRYCTTCGHTFRRGDRVLLEGRRVRHLVPGLNCGTGGTGGTGPQQDAADGGTAGGETADGGDVLGFTEGLLSAWPPGRGVAVVTVAADDWRIPQPGSRRPPVCLFCAHTFRPGELVVVCPCRPGHRDRADRIACGAAVHRDPAAGLPCWERWRPAGGLTICPVTKARV